MTAAFPPPPWTVISVLERSYAMARDNFPAFVTVTMVFAAGAVVIVALLGHGPIAHLVLWVYSAVAATVVQPMPAIFYVLLREEKEGATVEQIVGALD